MEEAREPQNNEFFRRDEGFDPFLEQIIADAVRHFNVPVDQVSGSINRPYTSARFSNPSTRGESSDFFKDKTNRSKEPEKPQEQ